MTATWIEALRNAPPSERSRVLESQVVAVLRQWLHMTPDEMLPLGESYFSLGLTSLGAVELQQHLEARLGRRIDSANLYNNPTVGHLLGYLREQVLPDLFPPAVTAAPAAGAIDNASRRLFNNLLSDLYGA
jgi:acyl carrier protein